MLTACLASFLAEKETNVYNVKCLFKTETKGANTFVNDCCFGLVILNVAAIILTFCSPQNSFNSVNEAPATNPKPSIQNACDRRKKLERDFECT